MGFLGRKKTANRRLGNKHVLDVKLRSDQVRAARTRVVATAFGVSFATIFGFFLVWRAGEWVLNSLVYENKAFAIENIDTTTDGVISTEQLKRWAGVKVGENLLALDLARVKRDMEMVSVVRSVAVERVLPHTLRLRVSEREAIAQICQVRMKPNGGYDMFVLHMDGMGCVMGLLDASQRAENAAVTDTNLPVISGPEMNQLVAGQRMNSEQVHGALRLIEAFSASPMSDSLDIRRVDISSPGILLVTASDGSQVTFATGDPDQPLRRWSEIYDKVRRMNKSIATLDLSVPNNTPGVWADGSTLPPVIQKSKKPQRTTRRNV
jgi:cell division septal protein FtsQ